MIDFAKYAFNKSHAAAYAVVSYQTAYLKYYFPVEFMAAIMTSVIDNPSKVAEYILSSRKMEIDILPPDINKGVSEFSVDNGRIRYGLSAIKGVGRPVIESIVEERRARGIFKNLRDFIERMAGKEVNKKVIENFIKAGAFDELPGNRRQKMMIYVSGHPLEEYEEKWRKNISAVTADFQPDEETGVPRVTDGAKAIVGGMIIAKTIKYTKTNKVMAFLTLEDLVGTVEVVVFPRDYEKNVQFMNVDDKVFIQGRVSAEDDKASKLICEKIFSFEEVPRELWLQFASKEEFLAKEQEIYGLLRDSDGQDQVVVYIKSPKAVKRLGASKTVKINEELLDRLYEKYGKDNVKVVEKSIEKLGEMN